MSDEYSINRELTLIAMYRDAREPHVRDAIAWAIGTCMIHWELLGLHDVAMRIADNIRDLPDVIWVADEIFMDHAR